MNEYSQFVISDVLTDFSKWWIQQLDFVECMFYLVWIRKSTKTEILHKSPTFKWRSRLFCTWRIVSNSNMQQSMSRWKIWPTFRSNFVWVSVCVISCACYVNYRIYKRNTFAPYQCTAIELKWSVTLMIFLLFTKTIEVREEVEA